MDSISVKDDYFDVTLPLHNSVFIIQYSLQIAESVKKNSISPKNRQLDKVSTPENTSKRLAGRPVSTSTPNKVTKYSPRRTKASNIENNRSLTRSRSRLESLPSTSNTCLINR